MKKLNNLPSLSVICTFRKIVSSSGFIVPVMVISVLFLRSESTANFGTSSITAPLGFKFWKLGTCGISKGSPASEARNGSSKSSLAGNLFETFSKHFPTKRRASASWILWNAPGNFPWRWHNYCHQSYRFIRFLWCHNCECTRIKLTEVTFL